MKSLHQSKHIIPCQSPSNSPKPCLSTHQYDPDQFPPLNISTAHSLNSLSPHPPRSLRHHRFISSLRLFHFDYRLQLSTRQTATRNIERTQTHSSPHTAKTNPHPGHCTNPNMTRAHTPPTLVPNVTKTLSPLSHSLNKKRTTPQ